MDRTLVPEELLFRWDDNGALQGVHYKEIEIYWKPDGTVDFRRDVDPRPITAEEAHALLGECHADLLALATSQAQGMAERDAQLDRAEQALAAEMVAVTSLQNALAAMTAERDALQARINQLAAAAIS